MLAVLAALPWLSLPLLWLARRGPRDLAPWIAAAADAIGLVLLVQFAPRVFAGEVFTWRAQWVESLGLALSFRLDGLAFLFALLILLIGLLIILYARYYLSEERRLDRFVLLLMLFTGAMLGVVLSGNLLLTFVFWELTGISSFLLIGYRSGKTEAREGARVALAVTGGGGLALLAGILLLGHVAGSFELDAVLASGEAVKSGALYLPILVLVLAGAFTKSAQLPFHFWLPGAMAAPTPVSAYLHSATLVKAGIFLLARLYPVLAGPDAWFYALTAVGVATFTFGGYQAIFRHDLKSLLAYSTVSHLGLIVLLLGIGTPLGAVAALFHVINHSIFKASLFMAAGIIDHETGTRDMRRLSGLWRYMPYTGILAAVAASAMAGVPLVNGFLSKEMFFGEALELDRGGGLRWIVPLTAVLGAVFSVAYSLRFIHDVFFRGPPVDLERTPHEPPVWMRIPVEVLVAACLLVGVLPMFTVQPLLESAVAAMLGGPAPAFNLRLWHGVNIPLIMSGVALGGGVLLYYLLQYGLDLHDHVQNRQLAKRAFDRAMVDLAAVARWATQPAYASGVTGGVLALLLAAALAGVFPFLMDQPGLGAVTITPVVPMALVAFTLMGVAAMGAVFMHRRRLTALVAVSVVGLTVALAFVLLSAPDLALTQLSVEVVSILLLLLALYYLPQEAPPERAADRALRDFFLGCLVGGGVGWLTWAMLTRPFDSISGYFIANSVPQGGGTNVVNVILVDFRGFDTYGEITVIGITALGIAAMLSGVRLAAPKSDASGRPWAPKSAYLSLQLLVQLLLPLALLVSAFLFLRGHNDPGGGFVAGLVTAVALVLLYLGAGLDWTQARLRLRFGVVAAVGLLIAGATGVVPILALDAPFLTSAHIDWDLPLVGKIPLASAMAFDLGVYLAVAGATMLVLVRLGEHGAATPPERA